MSYDQAVLRSQQAGGAFTFATLPTASQMISEPQGIMAYTSDQGMMLWNGATWVSLGSSGIGNLVTYVAAAGTTNNVNPGSGFPTSVGRLDVNTSAGDAIFSGLLAGTDQQQLNVRNLGTGNLTLEANNVGSSSANQFSNGGDLIIPAGFSSLAIYYGGSINKWVLGS